MPLRDKFAKMAHFAFSMQNCIHYFRWAAVLIVVTKSFWGKITNTKYGMPKVKQASAKPESFPCMHFVTLLSNCLSIMSGCSK